MTRVLVFGSTGFIGRQVARALEQHPEVSTLRAPGRDTFDLAESTVDELVRLLRTERPGAVVNCTGRLSGSGHDLVRANTVVTAKLVEAIAAEAPGTRLVRLGSAAEYGVVLHTRAVSEADATRPVSGYGVSHLAGTSLVQLATVAGDVDGVVLRVFNPIGPGVPADNMLGRAVALIRDAEHTRARHIDMGPLSAWRDFVDVRDVGAAVCAAALAKLDGDRVFNVGSGHAVQCREVVELLAATAGFDGEIRESEAPPGRSARVDWICADIARAGRVLRWAPEHELKDSIAAAWSGTERR
jgi:NDP-hexose 4-ketoreductase